MTPTTHLILALLITADLAAACILRALAAMDYQRYLDELYTM